MSGKPDFSYINGKLHFFGKEIEKNFFTKKSRVTLDLEKLLLLNKRLIKAVYLTEDTFMQLYKEGYFTEKDFSNPRFFDSNIDMQNVNKMFGAKRVHVLKHFDTVRITISVSKSYEYNALHLKGDMVLKF